MTDIQKAVNLEAVGVDESNLKRIALLPLVRVAWEDGEVDDAERDVILDAAQILGLTSSEDHSCLAGWLAEDPGWAVHERALRLLANACNTRHPDVSDETLRHVISECERVALAAGSTLGEAYRIEEREQAVIDQTVETLTAYRTPRRGGRWASMLTELGENPSLSPR